MAVTHLYSFDRVEEFSFYPAEFARCTEAAIRAKISVSNKVIDTGRQTRKWPEPKFRPSLNREASRLGDVRVRRPSFRAQVPETHIGIRGRQKLCASQRRSEDEAI